MFSYVKKLAVCTSLVILAMGCKSTDETIHTIDIPASVKLNAIQRVVEVDLLIPSKIFIHKDKLIVFEQTSSDMFKVFDLRSFKHLYSYGNIGRASSEITSPLGNDDIIPSEYVEIVDNGKLKYIDFQDSSATIVKSLALPLQKMAAPANGFKKINDSLYYFNQFYDPKDLNEFIKLNIATREQSAFSRYPEWISEQLEVFDANSIYLKSNQYNAYRNKIAAFYYSFPAMKIIDASSGAVLSETHINNGVNFSRINLEEKKIFFAEPFVTDNHIYVMWVNMPKQEASRENSKFKPNIFVFDWYGNIVANYELDHPVITFTVSEKYNKLYCTSFTGSNEIIEYDLPCIASDQEYASIENMFYKVELPSECILSGDRKKEIDIVHENAGYRFNLNYFTQMRDEKGKRLHDFTTIQIGIYKALDSVNSEAPFFKQRLGKDIGSGTFSSNDRQIVYTKDKHEYLNPEKELEILYILNCIFTVGQTDVHMCICSKNDDFNNNIQFLHHMVDSFTLKRDLNNISAS